MMIAQCTFLAIILLYGVSGQVQYADNCTLIPSLEFIAEDLRSETTNNTLSCCHLCNANPLCAVWTFDNSTGKCYLKHKETVSLKVANKISGRKQAVVDDFAFGQTLIQTDFANGNTDGWRLKNQRGPIPIAQCGFEHLLGGIGQLGGDNTLTWKGTSSHPFTRVKLWFRFWFLASWDSEAATLRVNGVTVWTQKNQWNSPGHTKICSTSFTDFFQDVEVMINLPTASNTIEAQFSTSLDQAAPDESWAISFFKAAIIPDYTQLPTTMEIKTLFGTPVSIYLAGSDFNDTSVEFQITTLPTFGSIFDPEIIVSKSPLRYREITATPYNMSAKGFQKVLYTPHPPQSKTQNQVTTQFGFTMYSTTSHLLIKEFVVSVQINNNPNYMCHNSSDAVTQGEVHSVQIDDKLKRVKFQNTYKNPVVFAMPLSANGGDPAVPRIAQVDTTGFTLHAQEGPRADGTHTIETVAYLVLEVGSWRLPSGLRIEVGKTVTSATLGTGATNADSWQVIQFPSKTEFSEAPIVLAQVQTRNDVHWVKARVSHITATGFSVALEEEDENSITHGGEIVAWVAIQPTQGELWGTHKFEVQRTGDSVTSEWFKIDLSSSNYSASPMFLADMQSHDNIGSSHLRYTSLSRTQVQVKWEADFRTRGRAPESQTTEVIGYVVIDSDGELSAVPSACYSASITAQDQIIEVEEGEATVVSLYNTESTDRATFKIVTLPTKGQLYQFKFSANSSDDLDYSAPIVNPNTKVTDPQNWLVYRAYQTFEGEHVDSFTFQSETATGKTSNVGTISISIYPVEEEPQTSVTFTSGVTSGGMMSTGPSSTSVSSTTGLQPVVTNPASGSQIGMLTTLVVIAFILIILMGVAIFAFGFFLYKKETARKEMVSLFLGEKNNATGETTYFPEQLEDNDM